MRLLLENIAVTSSQRYHDSGPIFVLDAVAVPTRSHWTTSMQSRISWHAEL